MNNTQNNQHNYDQKWIWMMEYCRINDMPPSQKYAWDIAKEKWDEHFKTHN